MVAATSGLALGSASLEHPSLINRLARLLTRSSVSSTCSYVPILPFGIVRRGRSVEPNAAPPFPGSGFGPARSSTLAASESAATT
jgi:hypothetical protein